MNYIIKIHILKLNRYIFFFADLVKTILVSTITENLIDILITIVCIDNCAYYSR